MCSLDRINNSVFLSSPHAQGDQGEEFHAKWICKFGTGAYREAM